MKKYSYEHRVYESVEDGSLSWAKSQKLMGDRILAVYIYVG